MPASAPSVARTGPVAVEARVERRKPSRVVRDPDRLGRRLRRRQRGFVTRVQVRVEVERPPEQTVPEWAGITRPAADVLNPGPVDHRGRWLVGRLQQDEELDAVDLGRAERLDPVGEQVEAAKLPAQLDKAVRCEDAAVNVHISAVLRDRAGEVIGDADGVHGGVRGLVVPPPRLFGRHGGRVREVVEHLLGRRRAEACGPRAAS